MDPRTILENGFQRWLEEAAASSNVPRGVPLDPYRSSLRNTKFYSERLRAIADHQPFPGDDPTQRFGDMRYAGVVEGTVASPALSPLGSVVLERWDLLGVADGEEPHELARAIVLLWAAVERGIPLYQDAFAFWQELRRLRSLEDWLGDMKYVYLAQHLNHTDAHGYNPWTVLSRSGLSFDGPDPYAVWTTWASTMPQGPVREKFVSILNTVRSYAGRSAGRQAFCRAMELMHLTPAGPAALAEALSNWGTVT